MLSIANIKDLFYMRIFRNNNLINDVVFVVCPVKDGSNLDLIATYSVTQTSANNKSYPGVTQAIMYWITYWRGITWFVLSLL